MLLAHLDQLCEVWIFLSVLEGVEIFQFGNLMAHFLDLIHDDHALQHHHSRIAVVEDVTVVFLADGGIDGDGDGPDHHDGHVEDVPLWAVAANQCHLVARSDA